MYCAKEMTAFSFQIKITVHQRNYKKYSYRQLQLQCHSTFELLVYLQLLSSNLVIFKKISIKTLYVNIKCYLVYARVLATNPIVFLHIITVSFLYKFVIPQISIKEGTQQLYTILRQGRIIKISFVYVVFQNYILSH